MEAQEITLDDDLIGKGYVPVIFAKDQPEYIPLPAISDGNIVVIKWKLSDAEIKDIFDNREIYLMLLTFKQPLQPVALSTKLKELV